MNELEAYLMSPERKRRAAERFARQAAIVERAIGRCEMSEALRAGAKADRKGA